MRGQSSRGDSALGLKATALGALLALSFVLGACVAGFKNPGGEAGGSDESPDGSVVDSNCPLAALAGQRQLGFSNWGAHADEDESAFLAGRDAAENIFVAGSTQSALGGGGATGDDSYVAKFDSNGIRLWITQLNSAAVGDTNGSDMVSAAITNTTTGTTYIAGSVVGGYTEASAGGTDIYVAAVDTTGSLLWITHFGAVTGGAGAASHEIATGIGLDSLGNVYVSGYTYGAFAEPNPTGQADVIHLRLNGATGAEVWRRQIGAATMPTGEADGIDIVTAQVTDSSGNSYVFGDTDGDLGETSAGSLDLFVAKYTSAGALSWLVQLGGTTAPTATGAEYARAITLGQTEGALYLTGATTSDFSETNAGGRDLYFLSLSTATGAVNLGTHFGTISGGSIDDDEGRAITETPSGNILILGTTRGAWDEDNLGGLDVMGVEVDVSGIEMGRFQYGNISLAGDGTYDDIPAGRLVHTGSNVYWAGTSLGSFGGPMAGDTALGRSARDVILSKMAAASLIPTWEIQIGRLYFGARNPLRFDETVAGSGRTVICDQNGYLYGIATTLDAADENGGGKDVAIYQILPNGTPGWISQFGKTLGAGTLEEDRPYAIALEPGSQDLIIGGTTRGALGEANGGVNEDIFVARIDRATGVMEWIRQLGAVSAPVDATQAESFGDMVVNAAGEITVVGSTESTLAEPLAGGQDLFLVRWDNAGNLVWVRQRGLTTIGVALPGALVFPVAMEEDSDGNLFVGATVMGADYYEALGGSADLTLSKFASSGFLLWGRQLGTATLGAAAAGYDFGGWLALDDDGGATVLVDTDGALGEANGGGFDVAIARFTSLGTVTDILQYGAVTHNGASAGIDVGVFLRKGVDGSYVFAGYGENSNFGEASAAGSWDIIAGRVDANLNPVWERQLGAVSGGVTAEADEYPTSLIRAKDGEWVMVGGTEGSLFDQNLRGGDPFWFTFDSSGDLIFR
ncbi:MAG: SBBP repeat-containing protein [Bdellovibrionales bacterium]|nr:SBBP repeat-containing protein [Bdellovibrionales bacterium]